MVGRSGHCSTGIVQRVKHMAWYLGQFRAQVPCGNNAVYCLDR